MNDLLDVQGNKVRPGDRVGVAFSYSRASVGYIKIGTVVSVEPEFKVRWDNDKVSPPMAYNPKRLVLL